MAKLHPNKTKATPTSSPKKENKKPERKKEKKCSIILPFFSVFCQ